MTLAHEIPPAVHPLPAVLTAIPVVATERLSLRAPTLADFPCLLEINQSVKETARSGARSRTRSFQDFAQMTATWIWRGHGWWAVDDDSGVVGFVGLGFEAGDICPELAYLMHPRARGKGYATEAASAARDYAREVLRLPDLISYVSEANTASQNVVAKLGARRDAHAEAEVGEPGVQVWRHLPAVEVH